MLKPASAPRPLLVIGLRPGNPSVSLPLPLLDKTRRRTAHRRKSAIYCLQYARLDGVASYTVVVYRPRELELLLSLTPFLSDILSPSAISRRRTSRHITMLYSKQTRRCPAAVPPGRTTIFSIVCYVQD